MKKKFILIACGLIIALTGCGSETETASGVEKEPVTAAENVQEAAKEETASAEQADNSVADVITQDQALEAVKNYCIANNPDLESMLGSEDYTVYFDVSTSDAGEIVVLFRSYTGAEIRYYVDPNTGDVYATELVPGIIDEEQRNDESFNIRDYLGGSSDSSSASESESNTAVARKDGDRFEGTVWLEGTEETVKYEHAVNDAGGFEIDYDYESMTRQSSADKESFVSIYDDINNPENYLEVKYVAENADAVAASISEELSKEYELYTDTCDLSYAGTCTRIDASACVGGEVMPDQLQKVYVVPTGYGAIVGTAHYSIEAAEGFGHAFAYMMDTLIVG
jgi:hypothetical protein